MVSSAVLVCAIIYIYHHSFCPLWFLRSVFSMCAVSTVGFRAGWFLVLYVVSLVVLARAVMYMV